MPGAGMKARLLAAAVGPVACDEGGTDASCLLFAYSLHGRNALASAAITRALGRSVPTADPDQRDFLVEIRSDRAAILNPETGIPRRVFVTEFIDVTAVDGEQGNAEKVSSESTYYTVTRIK